MNITVYSNNRLRETFGKWHVPSDFANPMLNYLVYGYQPGSCFTAVLANDFYRAISSSHVMNTVEAFKSLVGWINEYFPGESYGSYASVENWMGLTPTQRRSILERCCLIYTEEEEIMLTLRDEPSYQPVLHL